MAIISSPVFYSLLAVVSYVVYKCSNRPKQPAPYPPGPKPVPLLGNVRDLTAKELWLVAEKWAKEYGRINYLHVFGQGLVFLNTPEAVFDLLDKRGAIYSDKPHLVMAGELCGCENMVAFTRYGDRSRRQRRLMQSALGQSSIPQYHPLLEFETRPFLRRMLADPLNYTDHIRRYAGGLTLSVVYGYQVKSNDDQFLGLAEDCVNILSNKIASGGGIWPVDIFPSLQHLPNWMPGAGFKRSAVTWKKKMEEFVDQPYEYTQEEMKRGTARPSFVSTLLESAPQNKDGSIEAQHDHDIRWTANSMYSASIDTTITFMSHFILAMVQHPEVLERAQAEIDAVVGGTRLPSFEDRESLPLCNAIFNETLRWGAPVPLNLPHRLMDDDIYDGMYIPKGSLIFGNIWAITRDEKLYPEAARFNPDRFMTPAEDETAERRRDPRNYVFGFGRRRCPGANLIESSGWLLMTSMIATLDIGKFIDDHGREEAPVVDFNNSVFRTPDVFKCSLRPRSEAALRLVSQEDDA
ncbi:cytochrome P450 [Coniophora puteana RWD-64-598 SS2]|uniref:Cytochrome P450 n=1 Tax=Coniophora puteana (strain RWD-64-598) TaxID=741705 RepID=A0A5M3M9L6_CONPW|nr:cytochrome P450 [Coniophora puteana RWD-64-598 SS2]EIW75777.1 cytochrome P450 [Coniophora puteana RWD-64-598 SS2]